MTITIAWTAMLSALAIGGGQLPDVSEPEGSGNIRALTEKRDCRLDPADFRANAGLSFEDFDQRGTLRSTSRKLADEGCFAEAAEAAERYLVEGPVAERRQQSALIWHLGQYLAASGQMKRAASVISAARRPEGANDDLNWNAYVEGTWAFLVGNKSMLARSIRQLQDRGSPSDKPNLNALKGLSDCFGRDYRTAYLIGKCARQ